MKYILALGCIILFYSCNEKAILLQNQVKLFESPAGEGTSLPFLKVGETTVIQPIGGSIDSLFCIFDKGKYLVRRPTDRFRNELVCELGRLSLSQCR